MKYFATAILISFLGLCYFLARPQNNIATENISGNTLNHSASNLERETVFFDENKVSQRSRAKSGMGSADRPDSNNNTYEDPNSDQILDEPDDRTPIMDQFDRQILEHSVGEPPPWFSTGEDVYLTVTNKSPNSYISEVQCAAEVCKTVIQHADEAAKQKFEAIEGPLAQMIAGIDLGIENSVGAEMANAPSETAYTPSEISNMRAKFENERLDTRTNTHIEDIDISEVDFSDTDNSAEYGFNTNKTYHYRYNDERTGETIMYVENNDMSQNVD